MMKTSRKLILPLASCLLAISAQAQISSGLIGHWEFENNLTETSGVHPANQHDGIEHIEPGGTAVAYVPHTDPAFGQALSLDGTNGVYVANSSTEDLVGAPVGTYVNTYDVGSGAVSISLWKQGSPASWEPWVCKYGETGGTAGGWQVRRRSGGSAAVFTLQGTDGAIDPAGANTAATAAGWQHIVAVWDGTTRRLYVNGAEDATFTQASDAVTGAGAGPTEAFDKFLTFGMRSYGTEQVPTLDKFFTGQIDDVAIWDRALTPTEIALLSNNPLSVALANADTDGDGLFDDDEVNIHGTNPNDPDTDADGVNDFDEVQAGSDALNDNDFDVDGLTNLQETSGSANTAYSNETTVWNIADSDGDGILDGEEVIAGVDTYVTNPNDSDTDDDDWSDGNETGATPPTDPTDPVDYPASSDSLIGYWPFDGDLVEISGIHPAGLHDGVAVDATNTAATAVYSAGLGGDFGQAIDFGGYAIKVKNSRMDEPTYTPTFDADINTANAMSVSFWSNGALGRWSAVVAKYGEGDATNGTDGWQIRRRNRGADMILTTRNTGGTTDPVGGNTAATTGGVWKHVLAVWDGSGSGSRKIYINGVEDTTFTTNAAGSVSVGGPGDADDKYLTFGMRDNGLGGLVSFFGGEIDDVAIWSRALTPAEASLLANYPVSVVLVNSDTDGDGLFDDDEVNIHGTNPNDPDTDADGVNDFDEVQAGSDPVNDNDFDNDGLLNSAETSGSANPWTGTVLGVAPGDTTGWNTPDSDLDGILDGEEVIAGGDTYVTNPNDADTDDDGYSDGAETSAGGDPTNAGDIGTLTSWQSGLCGYWRLDGDLTDSGFLGADGEMAGTELTPNYVTGKFGQAVDLDKTNNQHVAITGDENYFDTVGSDMTVSIWITTEAFTTSWDGIFSKGEQSWRLARRNQTNGPAFAAGTVGDAPTTDLVANAHPINDGGWHHLVGVVEWGVGFSIYYNGYLVETLANAPNILDVSESVNLGSNPTNGKSWNGNIDDAAMWKRALTAEEIYTVFSHGTDVQDLIDNNVPPVTVIPDPEPAVLVIESSGFNGLDFQVEVSGMDISKSYRLWVTEFLDPANVQWFDVDGPVSGVTTHIFSETNPQNIADSGFYQVREDVAP
ncbi:MAG: LamG-like jellyroll fold domain-containing protein [Opitutaceae bacterium]